MAFDVHKPQRRLTPPEQQDPSTLNQANPVQNTWYNILPATDDCIVYRAAVNIEDTNETLEAQAIVDGQTYTAVALACTHSTGYYLYVFIDPVSRIVRIRLTTDNATNVGRGMLIEGRSVQLQVRKTTAAGAGNLTAVAQFGVYTETDV